MKSKLLMLSALAVGAAIPAIAAREGFGFTKKAVEMNRTRPPALNTPARRIKVVATTERSAEADDAQTLRRYAEDAMLAGAATMAAGDRAELTVKVAIDRLDSHESTENKTEYEYRQTGSQQVWNANKNKYETKAVYGNVPVQKTIKTVTASLTGAFEIADRSGRVIDSGELADNFNQKYEDGRNSPPPSRAEGDLLKRAARTVASRLVPTTERVSVLVPKGSFESLVPLAESNAWEQYLASVEAVAPNRDARQEAYRQYAFGVAKEGLAYASDDRTRALELLRGAAGHYEAAIRAHPGEKIFSEAYASLLSSGAGAPLPRVKSSVAAYEKWNSGPLAVRAAVREQSAPASKVLANEMVIEMAKAGLSEENILLAIEAADRTDFDVSPQSLISLAKSGVSKKVIARMQKATKR